MIEYFVDAPFSFLKFPMLDHLMLLFWKYSLIIESSFMQICGST